MNILGLLAVRFKKPATGCRRTEQTSAAATYKAQDTERQEEEEKMKRKKKREKTR